MPSSRSVPLIAAVGPVCSAVGLAAVLVSGFAYRWGVWGHGPARFVFDIGVWLAALGTVLSLIGLVIVIAARRGGVVIAVIGMVLGIIGFAASTTHAVT